MLARRLRPDGWLVFDAHTDAMMAFTSGRPVVAGEKKGHRFVIRSAVDPDARVCDTRIELTPADEAPFSEEHRHYFHRADEIRAALADSGFEVTAVRDEYSDRPADASTLSATWIARLSALTHVQVDTRPAIASRRKTGNTRDRANRCPAARSASRRRRSHGTTLRITQFLLPLGRR